MIFNDPELNFVQNTACLTDRQDARSVWVMVKPASVDITRRRATSLSIPDLCPLAQGGNCKPYGRLHVNLDESDEFGTFIFRTTGFNSIRTLAAR
jgi:hypothetical protein